MAYDIAGALRDPTQDLMQGYRLGQSLVQTQQQGKLAGLASQAMGQYGDQRQQTLQQAAAIDPDTAMKLHDQLYQNDQNYVTKAAQAARYVLSATQSGNPNDAEAAFQAIKPTMDQYAKITGKPFPDHFDPSMIPAMQSLVEASGQADKMQGNVVKLANGHYGAPMQSGKINDLGASASYAPEYDFKVDADGRVYRTDSTKGTAEWVTPSGGQSIGPNTGAALSKAYQDAIAGIESNGSGGYSAIGPATKTGDRAYGKYQVMGANIPQWTLAALGKSMTPQEFLANPQAQDAVFNSQFGKYVQQYGPEGAARAWFGGPGNVNNPNAKDVNGMTVGQYGQKFAQGAGAQDGAFTVAVKDKKGEADPAPELSDDAVDNAAARYNITGTLPPLGMGKAAATLRQRILDRAAIQAKAQGLSSTDLATQPGDYKNNQATLAGLQKSSAAMARATDALHANANLLLEQSKKVFGNSITGWAPENKLRLFIGNQSNDPDVVQYENYAQTVANEYAKILGGAPGSNQAVTDSAMSHAMSVIHKAASPEAMEKSIQALFQEAENFRNSNDAQVARIKASRLPASSSGKQIFQQKASGAKDFSNLWGQ